MREKRRETLAAALVAKLDNTYAPGTQGVSEFGRFTRRAFGLTRAKANEAGIRSTEKLVPRLWRCRSAYDAIYEYFRQRERASGVFTDRG